MDVPGGEFLICLTPVIEADDLDGIAEVFGHFLGVVHFPESGVGVIGDHGRDACGEALKEVPIIEGECFS